MRSTIRAIATLACGAFLVAACAGAGATPPPASVTPPPASPTPAATPTIAPTPTPVPMTDGQGPEHFSGLPGSGPYLEVQYKTTVVGDVTQYRGGVSAWDFTTTDPRMKGHASFSFSVDAYGTVGREWGTLEIKNGNGAWTGPCTAGAWDNGDKILSGCWLVGSGAYKGFSAYFSFGILASGNMMEGIIFAGSPPKA